MLTDFKFNTTGKFPTQKGPLVYVNILWSVTNRHRSPPSLTTARHINERDGNRNIQG